MATTRKWRGCCWLQALLLPRVTCRPAMRQSTPCYVNTDWFEERVMSNTGRLKPTLRYTQRTMQRGIATVLALLFSFLLILPAFTSSNLTVPLCCRKDGKHHCMLQSGGRADSGPAVAAMAARCPYCPHS